MLMTFIFFYFFIFSLLLFNKPIPQQKIKKTSGLCQTNKPFCSRTAVRWIKTQKIYEDIVTLKTISAPVWFQFIGLKCLFYSTDLAIVWMYGRLFCNNQRNPQAVVFPDTVSEATFRHVPLTTACYTWSTHREFPLARSDQNDLAGPLRRTLRFWKISLQRATARNYQSNQSMRAYTWHIRVLVVNAIYFVTSFAPYSEIWVNTLKPIHT